eukprot:TRINITY_DN9306_c0_g1_i1.p1 TRINITY_DN9306_c0_g1~~TRINITY_DN9306_c0_g1_i1.p1  ORF type:complete len:104 (-),score=6.26 TRINITY_DN9306_c0_g1_i1:618-929(-)
MSSANCDTGQLNRMGMDHSSLVSFPPEMNLNERDRCGRRVEQTWGISAAVCSSKRLVQDSKLVLPYVHPLRQLLLFPFLKIGNRRGVALRSNFSGGVAEGLDV